MGQVYPAVIPPLRSDRDTILIGATTDKLPSPVKMTISASDGSQIKQMTWNVVAEESVDDYAFLTELVDIAKTDDGFSLPTVGSAGLMEVARLIGARMDQLTQVAERAAASGDRESAHRILRRRFSAAIQATYRLARFKTWWKAK